MRLKRWIPMLLGIIILLCSALWVFKQFTFGQPIDSFNGVAVYYNRGFIEAPARNKTHDGYNLGIKYQCVEFVKRYYYEHLGHKMPNSYGHAMDFYDKKVSDGKINKARNLKQYSNPSKSKPVINDLVVFNSGNYGHVAIVSKVKDTEIEIIQQNTKYFWNSRRTLPLCQEAGKWMIQNEWVVGWLRKESHQ